MEGEAGDKKRAENSYTAARTLKGSDVLAAEMKEHSGKGVQGPAVAVALNTSLESGREPARCHSEPWRRAHGCGSTGDHRGIKGKALCDRSPGRKAETREARLAGLPGRSEGPRLSSFRRDHFGAALSDLPRPPPAPARGTCYDGRTRINASSRPESAAHVRSCCGLVQPVGLDECVKTHICHHGVVRSVFFARKHPL